MDRCVCHVMLGALALGLWTGCPRRSPNGSFQRQLSAHLEHEQIQQRPLGEWLDQLTVEACLEDVEALPDALAALRRLHHAAYEQADPAERHAIWQAWRRRLGSMSADGQRLVEVYLDSPARARQLFLCDDTLPASWKGLDAGTYRERALAYYESQVAEHQPVFEQGGADGARAVETLRELSHQIQVRYRAQYDERGTAAASYVSLEQALDELWDRRIDLFDVGMPVAYIDEPAPPPDVELPFDAGEPATYSDHPEAHLAGTTGLEKSAFAPGGLAWDGGLSIPLGKHPYGPRVLLGGGAAAQSEDREDEIRFANGTTLADIPTGPGGLSMPIPDPKDVIMAQRIIDSWRNTRRELVRQIGEQERRVASLERDLSNADESEGDALRAELARASNTLGQLTVDLTRHGNSLAGKRTGRAVADKLVAAAVPRESRATRRDQRAAAHAANQARDAVRRTEPPGTPGSATHIRTPDTGSGGGVLPGTDAGTTLTGGPGPDAADDPGVPGGRTLLYEGPCPLPDPRWSPEIVAALLSHDPSLDEVDARIVLSLIQRALPHDVERGVEEVVLEHLNAGFDLQLRRGHVDRLSDVVDPAAPADEQTVIQFQVTLVLDAP